MNCPLYPENRYSNEVVSLISRFLHCQINEINESISRKRIESQNLFQVIHLCCSWHGWVVEYDRKDLDLLSLGEFVLILVKPPDNLLSLHALFNLRNSASSPLYIS